MLPEHFAKQHSAGFQSIAVKSALNPVLWLVSLALSGGLLGLWYFAGNFMLAIFFMCVVGVPLLCACVICLYFAFRQPERLQSEEYQLKTETLRLLKTKGGKLQASDLAILQTLYNPVQPTLPPVQEEK